MKKYSILIFTIAIVFFFIAYFTGKYTLADNGDYSSLLIINNQQGDKIDPLFKGDNLKATGIWAPGSSTNGILRVLNNYGSNVKLKNLGMDIVLSRSEEQLTADNPDTIDYLTNMKMKVEYKNPLRAMINGIVYDGDFNGFSKKVNCDLSIFNGDYIDLLYTITMAEESQANVAGIKGTADFTVLIEGDTIRSGHSSNSGNAGVPSNGDIKEHWAHDCIETLIEKGVVNGYPDGKVKPENNITRAEAAVIVGRALKLDINQKNENIYQDDLPTWASGWIGATTQKGIFVGYPGRLFKSDKNITREEMTKVLIIAFNKKLNGKHELKFSDSGKVSEWALEFVNIGVQNKSIEGYPDNTFKPTNSITRAEAFTLVCKLMGWHIQHAQQ